MNSNSLPESSAETLILGRFIGIESRRFELLYTIAVVVLILWLLGLVSAYTFGGFIHILLAVAIVAVLIRVIQGRRI